MTRMHDLHHKSHTHGLDLRSIYALYKCDGCQELGYNHCYCCKDKKCNFHLHRECATPSEDDSRISYHHLLRKRVLRFRERPPNKVRPCIACGEAVLGFRYKAWHVKAHRSHNPFWRVYQHFTHKALHPCCKELSIRLDDGEISLKLEKKAPMKCQICDHKRLSSTTQGWAYVSGCGNYCYHVGCARKILEEYWQNQALERQMRKRKKILKVCIRTAKLALALVLDALGFGTRSLDSIVNSFFSDLK